PRLYPLIHACSLYIIAQANMNRQYGKLGEEGMKERIQTYLSSEHAAIHRQLVQSIIKLLQYLKRNQYSLFQQGWNGFDLRACLQRGLTNITEAEKAIVYCRTIAHSYAFSCWLALLTN